MQAFNLLDKKSPEYRQARKQALARVRSKQWQRDNPERAKENNKKYRNPFSERERSLMKNYQLTIFQYDGMWVEQRGRCAGCGEPGHPGIHHALKGEVVNVLHVDHDHKTGRVRGLLCADCNLALGKLKDSPATLRALAAYLEK